MANKMLIDAAHPEETRVVVVRGNRVEEFDFEAANRKQLRGNIYLAKVTRVEPSLQAAFVEYGGNRHGFLAFSEIHPDYYQIPVADRQALLDEESAHDDDHSDEPKEEKPRRRRRSSSAKNEASSDQVSEDDNTDDHDENDTASASDNDDDNGDGDDVESVGAEDAMEEVPVRRQQRRQYKIQEVIKRRQVLLVQVVKEERGNKGAALTTYLSLAGRYSVLMPNTARGGGISRKITQPTDRKRLKKIASELDVPEGMGVILRTAGASRTKAEIKRDFEYLMRLWENVRELTLRSTAPNLVYEEGSLIKRSIRDLYNKDIDQVLVAGEDGYREAKDFMRMLMPSHAKNVQPYREASPLFIRYGVEPQLDAMFSPQVTLKSGGYIVINQTEALVSIDVNSGKSTREHNIEDTALQTNLEASEEVARQLRLRDLAGLVVIDFIDMEENKNNRNVERKLKECLKSDRARIQVGRISHFGLMEMSRQRIRTGVLESSTTPCPHCYGTGMIRSVESVALHVLRSLEDNLLKGATHNLIIRTSTEVALYILNQKRSNLFDLETRFAIEVSVQADEMVNGQLYVLERAELVDRERNPQPVAPIVQPDTVEIDEIEDEVELEDNLPGGEEHEDEEVEQTAETEENSSRGDRRRRRRRKRRRGGQDNQQDDDQNGQSGDSAQNDAQANKHAQNADSSDEDTDSGEDEQSNDTDSNNDGEPRRKRRRGRRGGRRSRRGGPDDNESENNGDQSFDNASDGDQAQPVEQVVAQAETTAEETPAVAVDETPAPTETEATAPVATEPVADVAAEEAAPIAEESSAATEAPAARVEEAPVDTPKVEGTPAPAEETPEPESAPEKPAAPVEPVVTREVGGDAEETDANRPKRGGWWQRRSFF
ncbi:Rne/Rng family ribonuclease [Roseibium sp. CAU 1637]|uniref:Ribonuclease E n=1 Tax=Roseibium limicola TaxID=2816037 RepID=A0A939EL45_9HYPH|nr:ribonuclease E/G [Roseibium limicola]MBO0344579.1 Rne/Rng family ribonuclease [Roseibium limicola]